MRAGFCVLATRVALVFLAALDALLGKWQTMDPRDLPRRRRSFDRPAYFFGKFRRVIPFASMSVPLRQDGSVAAYGLYRIPSVQAEHLFDGLAPISSDPPVKLAPQMPNANCWTGLVHVMHVGHLCVSTYTYGYLNFFAHVHALSLKSGSFTNSNVSISIFKNSSSRRATL